MNLGQTQSALSIFKSYNGKKIRINPQTRYICITDLATASNKQTNDWIRSKAANEYLVALSEATGIPVIDLLVVGEGNQPTWAHPKVALRFAQWCSPKLAVQVDFWVDELLSTGKVELKPPQRQLPNQRSILDYIEAATYLNIHHDPLLKSLFSQRLAEELGANLPALPAAETQVIATVRANQLGYSSRDIGNGSQLGRFLISNGCEPTGKTQHGKYQVNCYLLTEELDNTIHRYFS